MVDDEVLIQIQVGDNHELLQIMVQHEQMVELDEQVEQVELLYDVHELDDD